MGIWEWWCAQLRRIGQDPYDNPNGAQMVQADAVKIAKAPKYLCISPIASQCTPGVKISRNTTTGALEWTTDFQNGEKPVTEKYSASTLSTIGSAINGIFSHPLAYTAAGISTISLGLLAWKPILPVTVTAGAGGDVGATPIIAAVAAKKLDVMLFWKVRAGAGEAQYIHKFAEDPAGVPAAVTPDWYTGAGITIPHAANESWPPNPYGERIMTRTVNEAFGVPALAAGSWPALAEITFGGFYREV